MSRITQKVSEFVQNVTPLHVRKRWKLDFLRKIINQDVANTYPFVTMEMNKLSRLKETKIWQQNPSLSPPLS